MTDGVPSRSDPTDIAELSDVVAELPDAFLLVDTAGRIVHANRAAGELLPELASPGAGTLTAFATDPEAVAGLIGLWRKSSARRPGVLELIDGRRLRCDGWRLSARPLVAVHLRAHEETLSGFQRLTERVDADNLRRLGQRLEATVSDLYASNRMLAATNERLGAALDELRQAEASRDELLHALPILLGRISVPDHRFTDISANVGRVLGLTEADVLASDFLAERVHPDDVPAVQAALTRVATHGTNERIEHRLRHADGENRWIASVHVPESDDDGRVTGIFVYGLDISQRRRAEQAQREAQEAAEAANRAKDEFLSRVSHELRTPLNAILGFGQLLEAEDLTEDQQEFVGYVLAGGRHLLDLINGVLDIARIESGDLALSLEAVDVTDLVVEAVDLLRPLAEESGIQLVVDPSTEGWGHVFADRQRAKQVLLNLLSNAVKYNRSRGTVVVSCERADDLGVRISVADTGRGIAPEHLARLFSPFDRLDAEQTSVEGTGIGLALSRRLAEAMGGTLDVTSAPGRGSTFSFQLPQAEGPVERYVRLDGSGPAAPAPSTTRRHVVLYVEDNLSSLALVERILASRGDVEIVPAAQGHLALDLARAHRPALVLLDRHLPDLDGEQVLQQLREDPATASVPVVVVSADATSGQIQRLLTTGAAAYLTKPIGVPDLLQVVGALLDAKDGAERA